MTAESLFTRTLRALARYDRRANARLYGRCAELPGEAFLARTLRSVDSRGEVHMDPVHRLVTTLGRASAVSPR